MADDQLARLAGEGSHSAFAAIYERYLPALTRYCRVMTRSEHDAEDAAQNAMVRAMRALADRPPPARLRPWLYRIAQHEAISLLRRRTRTECLDDAPVPVAASCEETAALHQRLDQLLADLDALPVRQREALLLRELSGRSYRHIASELEITEAAAQQAVFEARVSLQSFGEGRALACEAVQRSLSDRDHHRLRTRTVRAHLRACDCCRCFERAMSCRRRDLAAVLPVLAAGSVPARLLAVGAVRAVRRGMEMPLGPVVAKLAAAGLVAAAGAGIAGPPAHRGEASGGGAAIGTARAQPRLTAGGVGSRALRRGAPSRALRVTVVRHGRPRPVGGRRMAPSYEASQASSARGERGNANAPAQEPPTAASSGAPPPAAAYDVAAQVAASELPDRVQQLTTAIAATVQSASSAAQDIGGSRGGADVPRAVDVTANAAREAADARALSVADQTPELREILAPIR